MNDAPQALDFNGPVGRPFCPFPPDEAGATPFDRLEEIVEAHPDREAVRCGGDGTTYRALMEQVRRVAWELAQEGASTPVAIALPTDSRFPAAMLGALAAGRPYVPLDLRHPPERLRHILAHSGAARVLVAAAQRREVEALIGGGRPWTDVDGLGAAPDTWRPTPKAEDTAYIIYTSGSTGRPKGVYQHQRGLMHDVMQYTHSVHLSADDTTTLLYSPSVNGAIRDIFGALLNGACLCMCNLRADGLRETWERMIDARITLFHAMPPVLRTLLGAGVCDRLPGSVRLAYVAGDRFNAADARLLRSTMPEEALLYTGIGSTECATLYRQWFVPPDWPETASPLPVGHAIPDRELVLLDEDGGAVPPGEPGLIHVRSRFLARGYWNDPELTAAAFIRSGMDGTPMFRTGDRGRLRPDGLLEFHGRADRQAKVRGFRVELSEVEAALGRHPAVREVMVVAREDTPGDKRLVAYVIPKLSNPAPTHTEVRAFLQPTLPEYMIPSATVVLDAWPLTPNGKLDRAALPAPVQEVPAVDPPQGPDEQCVAQVFADLLRLPQVGRSAHFFEMGGDSLRALDAANRISKALGVPLGIADLVQHPTAEGVAATIAALRQGTSTVRSAIDTNATNAPRASFVRRLQEIVARRPRGWAMIGRGGPVSFRDLDLRSNRIANHLLGLGMKAGERVRIGAGVSPDRLILTLALLKVGSTVELDDLPSPAWVILDRRPGQTGETPIPLAPRISADHILILDELLHVGSAEWNILPSHRTCPPSVAGGKDLAFRGCRDGDLVTYGELDAMSDAISAGGRRMDIVGQGATPRRLLRPLLHGRTLAVLGRAPSSNLTGAGPDTGDGTRRPPPTTLAGRLARARDALRDAARWDGGDDDEFLGVVRAGRGGPLLVCVGDGRPIADLLKHAPPAATVLSLGMDGITVWPPRGYSLQEHLDRYVRLLHRHWGDGRVLVVGFSHGAALAHALASELTARHPIDVVEAPGRVRLRLASMRRTLRGWLTQDAEDTTPPYLERFEQMRATLKAIRREHPWRAYTGPTTLLGGQTWFTSQGLAWRRLCTGPLQEIQFGLDDHFAAFRDPASMQQWHAVLTATCSALGTDDPGSVRALLIEPNSSAQA